MPNKSLNYFLSTLLISTSCLMSVSAAEVDPAQIKQLTQQITAVALKKLDMLDEENPEQSNMSLDQVVSQALDAGKSIEDIRSIVSLSMEEVTGKPLGSAEDKDTADEEVSEVEETELDEAVEGDIPLTTVLLPNESLSSVAKRIYGPENGRRYLDIYELNKDVITNINIIPEGTVLKLPR